VLLVAAGASVSAAVERVRAILAEEVGGVIAGAPAHTPAAAVDAAVHRARSCHADSVVSVGGGSATGLGKAVAVACAVPLVAIPTTYAGSEMTPMWGRTHDGHKVTATDPLALPRAVLYDPELCRGMPPRLAAASGMNALAHCMEAVWLPGTSPMTAALAERGIRYLLGGLPVVVADSADVDGHAQNLAGACLAGVAMAQAGTGIHHRVCHVLGGGWNLPHAETHAVILPHSTALATQRNPRLAATLAALLDAAHASQRVFTLLDELGLPRSLAEIGMPASGLEEAVARVVEASADDPLVDGAAVQDLLGHAFAGSMGTSS
jgi:maleylacetate reductase